MRELVFECRSQQQVSVTTTAQVHDPETFTLWDNTASMPATQVHDRRYREDKEAQQCYAKAGIAEHDRA